MRALSGALLVAVACLPGAGLAAGDDAPKGEDVVLKTTDGLSIAATWYPPAAGTPEPAPAVVALPMYRHTRSSYEPVVAPVTSRGMGLLALDLRGHGGSAKQGDADLWKQVEAREPALFNAMHKDVEAAVAWLEKEKKTPAGRIALLGASVGCSVAIDTAVRSPADFGCVVCLTPGEKYLGVPTMEHVEKWPKELPLLLVASREEAKQGAEAIAKKLTGRDVELKYVAPADVEDAKRSASLHGTDMFGRVVEIEANLADWLAWQIAFRRVDLPGGARARIGVQSSELYVGIETPDPATPLDAAALRLGMGGVTDPWSKQTTVEIGHRLVSVTSAARPWRRVRLPRDVFGPVPGTPFAVAVSLDGKTFLPAADRPPILVTLR